MDDISKAARKALLGAGLSMFAKRRFVPMSREAKSLADSTPSLLKSTATSSTVKVRSLLLELKGSNAAVSSLLAFWFSFLYSASAFLLFNSTKSDMTPATVCLEPCTSGLRGFALLLVDAAALAGVTLGATAASGPTAAADGPPLTAATTLGSAALFTCFNERLLVL